MVSEGPDECGLPAGERVSIWDEWADENGELGPVYGKQWRRWRGEDGQEIDQVAEIVRLLRKDPNSRRMILTAWNVTDLPQMALSPCHAFIQFGVTTADWTAISTSDPPTCSSGGSIQHRQLRATDSGCSPRSPAWRRGAWCTFGDLHIYANHLEQVRLQLTREQRPLPQVSLDPAIREIDDFRVEHIRLENYDPWPAIKAKVAV